MSTHTRAIACPVCKKTVPANAQSPFFPFCSSACKNIDLRRWLDQRYAVDVRTGKLGLVEDPVDEDDEEHTLH